MVTWQNWTADAMLVFGGSLGVMIGIHRRLDWSRWIMSAILLVEGIVLTARDVWRM